MLQSADNLPLKRPSERVSITLHKDRLKLGDVNGLITALYTSTTIPSWISIEVIVHLERFFNYSNSSYSSSWFRPRKFARIRVFCSFFIRPLQEQVIYLTF